MASGATSMSVIVRKPPVCYYIRDKTSNLVLEVEKANHKPKAYVIVGKKHSESSAACHEWRQHWYFEDAGDGFVYIVSKLNGLVLDIKGHSHGSGAYLILYPRKPPPHMLTNQKWKLFSGFIESQLNEMVISIKGSEKAGSYVAMFPRPSTKYPHQQWVFEKVEDCQQVAAKKGEEPQQLISEERQQLVSEEKQQLEREENAEKNVALSQPQGESIPLDAVTDISDDQPQGESIQSHLMSNPV